MFIEVSVGSRGAGPDQYVGGLLDQSQLRFAGRGRLRLPGAVCQSKPRTVGKPSQSVEDDRGGQYRGTVMGSHSGWPWTVDAAFTPALDPRAARLALQFPNPFGNGVIRTTFELPPVGDHGQPR